MNGLTVVAAQRCSALEAFQHHISTDADFLVDPAELAPCWQALEHEIAAETHGIDGIAGFAFEGMHRFQIDERDKATA